MAFNGTEGGPITPQNASDMTKRWRATNPDSLKARFFGKDILLQLLDQEQAMGIRFYFGINEDNQIEIVACAADDNEDDILNIIADVSTPCPPVCGTSNILNS